MTYGCLGLSHLIRHFLPLVDAYLAGPLLRVVGKRQGGEGERMRKMSADGYCSDNVDPLSGLTEGRIVHYVLNEGRDQGQHRPAIIVRVWDKQHVNGCSQLQVFTDSDAESKWNDQLPPVMWKTSILYSEGREPGTWHWIERA